MGIAVPCSRPPPPHLNRLNLFLSDLVRFREVAPLVFHIDLQGPAAVKTSRAKGACSGDMQCVGGLHPVPAASRW